MRIPGIQDGRGGILARIAFFFTRRRFGTVVEPARVYALVPRIMMAAGKLFGSIDKPRRVPKSLVALAMARAARQVGCGFCEDMTSHFAREAKVGVPQLKALSNGSSDPAYSEDEADVLRFAEAMTATPARVDDALFARLRTKFGDEGMVELAAAIAVENFSARFNHSFGIGSAGFFSEACAVPARGS